MTGPSGTQAVTTAEAKVSMLAKPRAAEALPIQSLCDPASSIGRAVL